MENLNIYQKMAAITDELGVVAKNLSVSFGASSYKAVSERDVIDAVKPLETKYGVYSYPVSRKIVDSSIVTKESVVKGNPTKTNSFYMRVEVVYRFVNIDNPAESIDVVSYGDGIDTGDKASGKAMTYADKYALMKAYKISTGDDPDKDASPAEGYNEYATSEQVATIKALVSNIEGMLNYYGVSSVEELTKRQALEIIAAKTKK